MQVNRIPSHSGKSPSDWRASLDQNGYALISGAITSSKALEACKQIEQLTPLHWDFEGPVDHYKCVFNRSPFWLQFLDRSPVIDTVESVLGPDSHVIGQTAWQSHPGARGVGLHTDFLMDEFPDELLKVGYVPPAFIITAHFYLNDVHLDLGPTHLVSGSHRSGRRPDPSETTWRGNNLQPVTCKAGDVLLFRSDVWHSGSDNHTTDQSRYLLQVHYGRRMIAQKFSPYLDWEFNKLVLAACNPRQRRLLGDHERAAYD